MLNILRFFIDHIVGIAKRYKRKAQKRKIGIGKRFFI